MFQQCTIYDIEINEVVAHVQFQYFYYQQLLLAFKIVTKEQHEEDTFFNKLIPLVY